MFVHYVSHRATVSDVSETLGKALRLYYSKHISGRGNLIRKTQSVAIYLSRKAS